MTGETEQSYALEHKSYNGYAWANDAHQNSNFIPGYSAAALLAIIFALPFAWRVLVHREHGHWEHPLPAFYFAHLELFLGNGCLGIGVMMLLALTLERYVSVCHPGHARPILGSPRRAVALIPTCTFVLYIPIIFRSQIKTCRLLPAGMVIYQRMEDTDYVDHPLYSIYKVVLEFIFKVVPVILLAALNLRILIVYRRSCEKRRKMILSRKTSGEEDPRKFAEERRLVLLLGSTSILFLVCVTPMVILNVTLSENNLTKYPYQGEGLLCQQLKCKAAPSLVREPVTLFTVGLSGQMFTLE
ncbi:probable G-protein coupled receptor B0563.6 [Anoplophora glabripennis]|uniref:probable G-protein coupled receptor B0563.6 n=1 Tax=Anoplophora glabripennis TaxID=217634 RepID=UPI0008740332|nr:probable G-protein coupled receptor B0563.6 [Anoplophora glabripennis]